MKNHIAFNKFEEIEKLPTLQEKHKCWLKDYEGKNYSIALDEIHKIKWAKEPKIYLNKNWSPEINLIKELSNRIRIEFDGDEIKAKKHLEETEKKLKELKIGFIRSTHKGKSDYLWIEFTRNLKDKEKETFLSWIAPNGSEIDLNFASSKKVFQILYAVHWRHSLHREMPIEYFEGKQIDYDSLKLKSKKIKKTINKIKTKRKDFEYITGIKEAGKIFTFEGQAERFNEIQPLFYDRSGLFWLWNHIELCWKMVDEVDILNMIHQTTHKDVITSKNRTEILNALKQKGRLNIPLPTKKTWVQFKDTIVDIETGKEFPATPEYFVTNPIPWKLHKTRFINTPIMDKIFEEWVGKEYVKTLYEIIAYCLIPSYPIHRLFCFIGSGLNGKSCFLRLLKKFIGNTNITSTELDVLLSSRFEVTRLHKKLVCIMGETNFSEMNKTSIIKKLTGEDIIGFEYKNKTPFEDDNYDKILIATINLPTTTDKTIGFYRKWLIIDFPIKFSEKKVILKDIPEEEFEMLSVKCLVILKDLLTKREFNNEGEIEDRMRRYEDRSDPLEKFLKEFIIEEPERHIFKWEFEKRLNEWCKEKRFRQIAGNTIGKKMKEKEIENGRVMTEWYENDIQIKKQVYAWKGIGWK